MDMGQVDSVQIVSNLKKGSFLLWSRLAMLVHGDTSSTSLTMTIPRMYVST